MHVNSTELQLRNGSGKEVENVGAEQKPHVAWITILKLMSDVRMAEIGCHYPSSSSSLSAQQYLLLSDR